MSVSLIRREFERARIQGIPVDDCIPGYGCDPVQKLRWEGKILSNVECEEPPLLSAGGRRLNNFCIGSDPEFVFTSKNSSHKMNASDLGLKPGLAAGSDQNLRLAELRGWPSTSVIEHIAGLLSSLRWMYRLYPNTRTYGWRAGAWHDQDGIGGHVHFGRKRATRPEEILGLDGLAKVFRVLGIFNNTDWDRRIQGDPRGQRYGDYGDFRVQLHGYEYRSLPSWLCSPSKAFLAIAASKLVIFDPHITSGWRQEPLEPTQAMDRLKRLAQYYAGQDDDAWILKHLLSRKDGFKAASAIHPDFKKTWGFNHLLDRPTAPPTQIMPPCIAPDKADCADVIRNISEGVPLEYTERTPTFRNILPENYHWMYCVNPRGVGRGGVGDLMSNLVCHVNTPVNIQFAEHFEISSTFTNTWSKEDFEKARELVPEFRVRNHNDEPPGIWIPRNMTLVDRIRQTRTFLLKSGLLPLWTVEGVTANSLNEWTRSRKQKGLLKVVKAIPEERVL